MIQLKSMAFENAEEKRVYDLLAIDWVKYHDEKTRAGEEPVSFQDFIAQKKVSFKFKPTNELGQVIVQPKEEKAVKSENLDKSLTLAELRAKYLEKFGKRAFNGWDEAKLTELIK